MSKYSEELEKMYPTIGKLKEETRRLQHAAHESYEAGSFGEEKRKHSEKEDLK